MIFVTVSVTGSVPDIVVVVGTQPKTDEQKLVRDAVLVFVLRMALEHDDMDRIPQDACARAPSRRTAVTTRARFQTFMSQAEGRRRWRRSRKMPTEEVLFCTQIVTHGA